MMTDWVQFFQILTMHRAGCVTDIPYEIVVNHLDAISMARRLDMVPMPDGHSTGLSKLAIEWQMEGAGA